MIRLTFADGNHAYIHPDNIGVVTAAEDGGSLLTYRHTDAQDVYTETPEQVIALIHYRNTYNSPAYVIYDSGFDYVRRCDSNIGLL